MFKHECFETVRNNNFFRQKGDIIMNEGLLKNQSVLEDLCVNTIRTLSMDAVQKANSGHPGAPMGLAPAGYTLWTKIYL